MASTHTHKPGYTRTYLSREQLAAALHIQRGHLYRLAKNGLILEPDIILVRGYQGWDPDRSRRFGVAMDLIDKEGNPIPGATFDADKARTLLRGTRFAKPEPDYYVGSWVASEMYGLSPDAVLFIRRREGFVPADVLIGKTKHGWTETAVIRRGEQTGRMDAAAVRRWVEHRTVEYGMPLTTEWVQKYLKNEPELRKKLEKIQTKDNKVKALKKV